MADDPTPRADMATSYLFGSDRFALEATDLRVHDVALRRWFNKRFLLREGYPCPVIMSAPMDAYAQFNRLFKGPSNPYAYLTEMADYKGTEPAALRFPLISVEWKTMRYRPEQSYASRTNRRLYYPTVSDNVTINDMATVAQARFPAAYTFVYQVDFWCARRDTLNSFAKQLTSSFRVMSAGTPQTFIPVVFPNYFGALSERLVMSSEIANMTESESNEKELQHRLSFTLELEGYAIDWSITVAPVLWKLVLSENVSPGDLDEYFDFHTVTREFDLRAPPLLNATLVNRHLPPAS